MNGDLANASDSYLSFLREIRAQDIEFFDRDILSHLIGTRDVLMSWESNEALARAGLFHAMYLTEFFKTHEPTIENRNTIASIIGVESEELVYFYCTMDRVAFVAESAEPRDRYFDNYLNTYTSLSKEQDKQLVELSWANAVEQLLPLECPFSDNPALQSIFEASKHRVGPNALTHYLSLLQRSNP